MNTPDKPRLPNHLTSEQLLSFAFSGLKAGRWVLDQKSGSISVDEHFRILVNYHKDSTLTIDSFSKLFTEKDNALFHNALKLALSPGSDGKFNILVHVAKASAGSVHLLGQAYRDETGEVGGLIGSAVEIPHFENAEETSGFHKNQQPDPGLINGNIYGIKDKPVDYKAQAIYLKELQASQQRFRSIISSAPAAMGIFTGRDLVVDLPNQAFIEIIGKGPDIAGKKLADLLPELESQDFLDLLDHVFTSGKSFQSFGTPLDIARDGMMVRSYYNISFTPLRNAEGEVYAILDISVDVTEMVLAKQKVELAEGKLRHIIELAEIGTWQVDLHTNMVDCSARLKKWYGLENPGLVLIDEIREMIDPDDFIAISDTINFAADPENSPYFSCEYTITPKNGQKKTLRDQGQVHFDHEGKPAGISGSVQDITNQIKDKISLEKQVNLRTIQLKDSLADLERSNTNLLQFAYVASHDLQEPLRKIQTFSDLLRKRYPTELGSGIEHLDRIQTAASRMSILIRDLLEFSGISTGNAAATLISLDHVLDSVMIDLEMSIQESGAHILANHLPEIKGDSTQLSQLFTNLLSNAIKFRRPNIEPMIEINCTSLNRAQFPEDVVPTRHAEEYYRIDVVDNGIGFESKYNNRIFQVFQRLHTKAEFDGTGIGLAICEKVVANHGGDIKASGIPGKGSTFSIFLPI